MFTAHRFPPTNIDSLQFCIVSVKESPMVTPVGDLLPFVQLIWSPSNPPCGALENQNHLAP